MSDLNVSLQYYEGGWLYLIFNWFPCSTSSTTNTIFRLVDNLYQSTCLLTKYVLFHWYKWQGKLMNIPNSTVRSRLALFIAISISQVLRLQHANTVKPLFSVPPCTVSHLLPGLILVFQILQDSYYKLVVFKTKFIARLCCHLKWYGQT